MGSQDIHRTLRSVGFAFIQSESLAFHRGGGSDFAKDAAEIAGGRSHKGKLRGQRHASARVPAALSLALEDVSPKASDLSRESWLLVTKRAQDLNSVDNQNVGEMSATTEE